jgi:hypothetical protein
MPELVELKVSTPLDVSPPLEFSSPPRRKRAAEEEKKAATPEKKTKNSGGVLEMMLKMSKKIDAMEKAIAESAQAAGPAGAAGAYHMVRTRATTPPNY